MNNLKMKAKVVLDRLKEDESLYLEIEKLIASELPESVLSQILQENEAKKRDTVAREYMQQIIECFTKNGIDVGKKLQEEGFTKAVRRRYELTNNGYFYWANYIAVSKDDESPKHIIIDLDSDLEPSMDMRFLETLPYAEHTSFDILEDIYFPEAFLEVEQTSK